MSGQVVLRCDPQGFRIDNGDPILVFEIDEQPAIAVRYRLLGLAAQVQRADDGSILAVDDGRVSGPRD